MDTIKTKLPDKLSDLLELSLNDCAKVRRSKRYALHMNGWHGTINGTCYVCMAGAIMAQTLRCSPNTTYLPTDIENKESADGLRAVNLMRTGQFAQAQYQLSNKTFNKLTDEQHQAFEDANCLINDYFSYALDGGRAPWHVYRKAVRVLRKAKL